MRPCFPLLYPWDTPFMNLVRNGVPLSALAPLDPGAGDVGAVEAPRESPAKRARAVGPKVGTSATSASRDGVLTFWSRVAKQSPATLVGGQVRGTTEEEVLGTISDVMAMKATATLIKRRGSLMALERWGCPLVFPIDEQTLYRYVKHLESEGSASSAQSFIEAVRFTCGMLGTDINVSTRIRGCAAKQLRTAGAVRQRSPLTVVQVAAVEKLVCCMMHSPMQVFAGYFLFVLHSRCRFTDAMNVRCEPVVDTTGGISFVEAVSLKTKTSQLHSGRKLEVPLVGYATGVSGNDWAT
eukprot:6481826-Amphidinium_carterae.1